MSSPIISVQNLGKQYRLGSGANHDTLRDHIAHGFKRLLGRADERADVAAEEFWALKDVSFDVPQGEVVGIIGRNGAGKSTLLKVLSQITEPTEGEVRVRGRVASLLEVGTGFHPELSGRENVFLNGAILGMSKAEIKRKFDEIVAFAEVEKFLDTPVKRYSSGMYVRLAFAVAAHLEPEILVVDEVLAVGDAAFQKKCMGKMKDVAGRGRTVLFVSHNMAAVSNLCQRGIVLERGRVKFDGVAREALQHYNTSTLAAGALPGAAPHVIYARSADAGLEDYAITRIEMFDHDGKPKPCVSSGDAVVFRMTYFAKHEALRGSVQIQFGGFDGSKVLYLSTEPDSGFAMSLQPGEHAVECVIDKLPLAAGQFIVGAGLAIPWVEYLSWSPDLCTLAVASRDVYNSGYAPSADRSLIITPHRWRFA
jgi:lipopolysaccharide transport system ATP-binding protein